MGGIETEHLKSFIVGAQIFTFIAAILVAIVGLGAFWAGLEVSRRGDAELATAKKDTAVALASAGTANAAAANANERAMGLEVVVEKERTKRADLELRLAKTRSQIVGRSLTTKQKIIISAAVRGKLKTVLIAPDRGNSEASLYASQLMGVLSKAGVHIQGWAGETGSSSGVDFMLYIPGLAGLTPEQYRQKIEADPLYAALHAAGLAVGLTTQVPLPGAPSDIHIVCVGGKSIPYDRLPVP